MSKLMNDLKSIFEEGEKEYEVMLKNRIDELYKIISKDLKEAVKDTSNGLVYAYTYKLHQTKEEQIIEPFEPLVEGIEEKFEGDGIDVEQKSSHTEDGERDAQFTFSGWA